MLRLNKNNYLRKKRENIISEENLENIHPYFNQNFTSLAMNSGIMNVYHNDPEILSMINNIFVNTKYDS